MKTIKKYMRMPEEDRSSDIDEDLIKNITMVSQGVSSGGEVVAH